jgi:hypothetical protein
MACTVPPGPCREWYEDRMKATLVLLQAIVLGGCHRERPSPVADAAPRPTSAAVPSAAPTASAAGFCRWALAGSNCWGMFVASVDGCLGSLDAGAKVSRGRMGEDTKSCAYANGRAVRFAARFTPGASMGEGIDVTVTMGTKECIHLVRKAGSRDFDATSPAGKVSIQEEHDTTTLTCPDGARLRFTEEDILSCGVPEPEIERKLPGLTAVDRAEPRSTAVTLSGGEGPIFDCEAR